MATLVVKDGQRQELQNVNNLAMGDSVAITGLDVKRIQFVRQWEITQVRRPDDDPSAEAREVQVPQWHFNFSGRSFTVTGNGLAEQGAALVNTIKGTAKGGDRVKEVYLVANEWHPQLTDAQGNLIYEDDSQTIPALNMEMTNKSFTFSGLATADEVAASQDDELAYEAKKAKITSVSQANIEEIIAKAMQKFVQPA